MRESKFLNRELITKIAIVAGVVVLLVVAIILIVSLGGGKTTEGFTKNYNTSSNIKNFGENGDLINAYPNAGDAVKGDITTIALKGFATVGGESYALLLMNGQAMTLAKGDSVADVTITAVDEAGEKVTLSVSGTAVELTFDNPLANIQR